jgi:hypothetical protein
MGDSQLEINNGKRKVESCITSSSGQEVLKFHCDVNFGRNASHNLNDSLKIHILKLVLLIMLFRKKSMLRLNVEGKLHKRILMF